MYLRPSLLPPDCGSNEIKAEMGGGCRAGCYRFTSLSYGICGKTNFQEKRESEKLHLYVLVMLNLLSQFE